MARRRKLNKRVAVLLVALGAVVLALVLTVVIQQGTWGLLDRFFPRDPGPLIAQAMAALKQKDYRAADKAFQEAIDAARAKGSPQIKEYFYEYARMNHQWFQDGTGLTQTQRNECLRRSISLVHRALNRDPAYVEAQQFLCDIRWQFAVGFRAWPDFIKEADKLLELTPGDHKTLFRRARAKGELASRQTPGQTAREAIADFNAAIPKLEAAIAEKLQAIESAKDDAQKKALEQEHEDLRDLRPRYWLGMIRFLSQIEGRDQDVDRGFDRAIQALPEDARILIARGAYLRAKGLRKLAGEFRAVLLLEPQVRQQFLEAASRSEAATRQVVASAKLDPELVKDIEPAIKRGPTAARQLAVALPLLESARQCFEQAIRHDPVSGHVAMANHLRVLNRPDEALAILEKANEIDRLDPRPYIDRARIYSRRNEEKTAADVLREGLAAVKQMAATQSSKEAARREAASRLELSYLLAGTLLTMVETGRAEKDQRDEILDEARKCMREMTSLGVRGPARDNIAGRIACAEGKEEEALPMLERAYQESRSFSIPLANLLINVYMKRRLPGKAEGIIDRFLSIPGQQSNIPVLMAKARLLMRYRDIDKANRIVERALKIDPENAEALNMKTVILAVSGEDPALPPGLKPTKRTLGILLNRAAGLWQDGRREEALRYTQRLHEAELDSRAVISLLSRMYQSLERFDEARTLLEGALKRFPDDEALLAQKQLLGVKDKQARREILLRLADKKPPLEQELEKANIEAMFGRQDAYLAHLQAAAKIDPNAWGVVERLFRLALVKEDWKLADDCVARARAANLDGSGGQLYQTRLAMRKRDFEATIAAAMEVLRERPDRKDARVLLGNAYLQKKDYEQAYQAFKIVADNDPGHAPALIGLAAVTAAQGKRTEHRSYVRAAYRLAPDNAYIREAKLEIDREDATPEELIKQREQYEARNADDLRNIAALAMLYERVAGLKTPDDPVRADYLKKAEQRYITLFRKSPNKLFGTGVLCRFYLRRRRLADLQRVIEPLLDTWKDRVGMRILYGELVTRVNPRLAKEAFEKAIAADVKDPRGHRALARYWAEFGQWPSAALSMTNCVHLQREKAGANVAGEKELIRYQIEAREYEQAAKRIDEILRRNPTDAGALTLKGDLAFRRGEPKIALELFTQAVQDNPTYAWPLILRARLYLVQGEPAKAQADLQAARRLTNRVEVSMQLAAVYESLRDYDNAELVYREILGEHAAFATAIDRLLAIYSRRQKWDRLESLLGDAQQLFPNDVGYVMAEAVMWDRRDNQPRKLAALARAIRLGPDQLRSVQVYLLALQEANQHEQVLTASWPYLDRPKFVQWVAAIRAGSLAKLGRHPEADKLFLRSLQTIPAEYVLMAVGQLRNAYGVAGTVERFKKWVAADPKNWRLHFVLGALYSDEEKLAKGAESLQAALALAPDRLSTFFVNRHLGTTYYRMKKFPEAERAYLTCLKARPTDYQVLNNLAYMYTNDLDKPKEALPFAERAASRVPNNARVLDTYAWTLAKIGKFAEAEQVLLRAVRLESPLTATRYHLGWVYEKIGRLQEALKQYKQGFEMVRTTKDDPLYEPLQQAVARLGPKAKTGA